MSGWIKLDKPMTESLRFRRFAKELSRSVTRHVTVSAISDETVALGGLARLWLYADTHIRDDNTLDASLDEIDEIAGIQGFGKALPVDWLKVIDANRVELPDFLAHNGTSARLRKQGAARQARYRHRTGTASQPRDVTHRNALRNGSNDARPDQTRPDQTRPEDTTAAKPPRVPRETPDWFLDFKLAYPERSGDQPWRKAIKAANGRIGEGHTPDEFIEGAQRYAAFIDATGKRGTEFVKQAATFLGPEKPFLLPWTPPATRAETRLASNLTAADEFLRRTDAA